MTKRNIVLLLVGLLLFAYPAYLLRRSPAIEVSDFHIEPADVTPGQNVEAVWTVKSLRPYCYGTVMRRMLDSKQQIFTFAPTPTVRHGPAGSVQIFHSRLMIPRGMAGGTAIFERDVDRWCNWLQQFWPMREYYRANFTVG